MRWLVLLGVLVGAHAEGDTGSSEISGQVLDLSGAPVYQAAVTLGPDGGGPVRHSATDLAGRFRFDQVGPGSFQIRVRREGFKPSLTRLRVGARSPRPVRISLSIADLHQELTVTGQTDRVSTEPFANLDVVRLDRAALDDLPVLGQDVVGTIARFLDSASVGSAGVTLVVDGMETSERGVSASAIREVRINQNPYSAEFSRPGRGRIEIITQAGSDGYHGTFNFLLRDHRLDARNAFAVERPREQRRIYEGHVTGPLGRSRNNSFLISVDHQEEDREAIVYARSPLGEVRRNVPTPKRETELSARLNRQIGRNNTLSFRYEFTDESDQADGVGGFNLAETAADLTNREHHIYYTQRTVISSALINEFYLRGGRHNEFLTGRTPGVRKVVVLDSFTGGGAQVDLRQTENHVQLTDVLSWSRGKQSLRAGVNVPDLSRRGWSDRSNTDGTFYFSTLEDYLNGHPFSFVFQQGDGYLAFWQKDVGLFVQHDVRLRPNLSVAFGLRYDWQNFIGDRNNLAPRLSLAWSPDKGRETVLRAGAGFFYDRTGSGPEAEVLRFNGRRLRPVLITEPGFPDPFSGGGPLMERPVNIVRFSPGLRSPYTVQYSLGVERQLQRSTTLTATYLGSRGIRLFRSRDANAPLPPLYLRPEAQVGVLRQIESAGRLHAHAVELAVRGNLSRFFNGTLQYALGRAYDNTGGIGWLPADHYDLSGEWSRADFDQRHRFLLMGTLKAAKLISLGVGLSLHSGRRYTLTTGRDDNRDGFARDRPRGVRRNTQQGPGSATLDLRCSREFSLLRARKDKGPAASLAVDAFNVLNRVNYAGFVGNLSSPFFGQPVAARPARRLQLSLRLKF